GHDIALAAGQTSGRTADGFNWQIDIAAYRDDAPPPTLPVAPLLVRVTVGWSTASRASEAELTTLRLGRRGPRRGGAPARTTRRGPHWSRSWSCWPCSAFSQQPSFRGCGWRFAPGRARNGRRRRPPTSRQRRPGFVAHCLPASLPTSPASPTTLGSTSPAPRR